MNPSDFDNLEANSEDELHMFIDAALLPLFKQLDVGDNIIECIQAIDCKTRTKLLRIMYGMTFNKELPEPELISKAECFTGFEYISGSKSTLIARRLFFMQLPYALRSLTESYESDDLELFDAELKELYFDAQDRDVSIEELYQSHNFYRERWNTAEIFTLDDLQEIEQENVDADDVDE
jgi:hypothetical protein